jgi:DNA-binding response OmpR family regulator
MTARILVVEDDAAGANRLLHLLATEGYAVEWARSADRARTLLSAARPADWDLVISAALATPGAAPEAWLRELRTLTTSPIVIVAGWSEALFIAYVHGDIAALVKKPVDPEELLAVVARHVDASTEAPEEAGPEPDGLLLTTLPAMTYRTYAQAAQALETSVPTLARYLLSVFALVLAEANAETARQPGGAWPEGLHLYASLWQDGTILHRGVEGELSRRAVRVHARAAGTVTRAGDLLERAGALRTRAQRIAACARSLDGPIRTLKSSVQLPPAFHRVRLALYSSRTAPLAPVEKAP